MLKNGALKLEPEYTLLDVWVLPTQLHAITVTITRPTVNFLRVEIEEAGWNTFFLVEELFSLLTQASFPDSIATTLALTSPRTHTFSKFNFPGVGVVRDLPTQVAWKPQQLRHCLGGEFCNLNKNSNVGFKLAASATKCVCEICTCG